jgi:hypothetical protein
MVLWSIHQRALALSIVLTITAAFWLAIAPFASAQTPGPAAIRVESDDVLVPVRVVDRQRYISLFRTNEEVLLQDLFSGNFAPWNQIYVHGLTARDFRLLEDGREQRIRSVIVHVPRVLLVSDNFGRHFEFVGSGGGRWTLPDHPTPYQALNFDVLTHWPSYIVAYDPPPSRPGDCHQVAVQVDRPGSLVYSEKRYCRNTLDPADPLADTSLNRLMQAALSGNKRGKIPLSLAIFPHLRTHAAGRVQIVLEFPWRKLYYTLKSSPSYRTLYETVGVLGSISSSDGSQVAHFTDVEGHNSRDDINGNVLTRSAEPVGGIAAILNMPRRYDRDVYLPPGAYRLRIVLSDGRNFGRAEASFRVEAFDPNHPAISEIALGRRFQTGRLAAIGPRPGNASGPPLVSQSIDFAPAADRTFSQNGAIRCYFDLYLPEESLPNGASVQLRILRAKHPSEQTPAKKLAPFSAAPYAVTGSPIISVTRAIDLKGLPKGNYRLQAQLIGPGGAPALSRTADFRIR